MSLGIALDDAAIMSTSLEAILYGFSVLMFIGTMWVLTREKGRTASNRMMISVAVILLVLSTAHMIVDIVRIDHGLVKEANTFPGGPNAFFGDVAQPTFVIKNAIYTLQTLLGDGVVIYRCYVVWQSFWSIVLPSLLWCSVAVSGVGSVYSVSQATTNASDIFAKETAQWITAFYASTLTANLLSSGLLAYRIWMIERSVASVRVSAKSTIMPVLRILVDAALLYSATLFTALLCFVNSNNGQYVVLDMVILARSVTTLVMPIISIAFYMVLIRVAMGQQTVYHFSSAARGTAAIESHDTSYGMRPMQVHISQFSRNDSTPPYQPRNQEVEKGPRPSTHKARTYEV
ncbi:hypothetical protein HD554DRAFT_2240122 [Boletus coccyginus]|nr:hypothetical protein HD554DRAFT_2240122 [Boletus coccyginus]